MKNRIGIFLIACVLSIFSLHASNAAAALGDRLNKWGRYYPITVFADVAVDSSGNIYAACYDHIKVFDKNGEVIRQWGTRGNGDGQFEGPEGITVDAFGNVYVLDTRNHRVQVFSTTGDFIRKWGSLGSGDGQFVEPVGIALDSNGNIYITERYNYRVQVFSKEGVFIRKWGSRGNGDGQFAFPWSVAVDSTGNVYVVDSEEIGGSSTLQNDRVQVFSNTGEFLRKWGTRGTSDGQFRDPRHIVIDSSGNVLIADTTNNRIQIFSNTGAFLGKFGSYGSSDGMFQYPLGITIDGQGVIYAVDSYNRRIQLFSSAGSFLKRIGGYDSGPGMFNYPQGIAVDSHGDIYVADTNNHRVQVFDNAGHFLRMWGSVGYGDGQFFSPMGIAFDLDGNVYVASMYKVQLFSKTGQFIRSFGSSGSADGQFANIIYGIAVDNCGNIYVSDTNNDRIQVFNNSGKFIRKWGSTGYGDGQFRYPAGVALDENENVYVAGNGRIQVFTSMGTFLRSWRYDNYGIGYSISISAAGILYNGSSYWIQLFANDGKYLGSWGQNGEMHSPYAIAVDRNGIVYEADYYTSQVQIFDGRITSPDTQPPVTTATLDGLLGNNGWFLSNVVTSMTATDAGSGVKEIHYAIDGGAENVMAGNSATASISGDNTHTIIYYAKDNAGNEETHHTLAINIDKTAPTIAISGVANGAVYTIGAVPQPSNTVSDNLSGVATQNAILTGGDSNNVGTYTYTVMSTDNAGNSGSLSTTYSVVYNFRGFLTPVSLGQPFRLGSTIPVKFQLTDAGGNYISTANATFSIQLYSSGQPVGDPIEVTSTSSADTGNTFRYSALDNQYIYNLSTTGLSEGTWQVRAALDDGTVKTAFIALKSN